MKIIKATTGEEIMVSDEDYPLLSRHNWSLKKGYAVTVMANTRVYMHRIVIGKIPSGMVPDHMDRNKLNNTKENLRPSTYAENAWNSPQTEGLQSPGYVGVRVRKKKDGSIFYEASASVNHKDIYIGRGDDEIEVAKMRDAFVYRTRGEFAYLNFSDNIPEYEIFEFKNKKLYQYF